MLSKLNDLIMFNALIFCSEQPIFSIIQVLVLMRYFIKISIRKYEEGRSEI